MSRWVAEAPNEIEGSIVLEHDLLPLTAQLGVVSLMMVNSASLKIKSIEECFGKNFHTLPFAPPNTSTSTNFPAPLPKVNQGSAILQSSFYFWGFLLGTIVFNLNV